MKSSKRTSCHRWLPIVISCRPCQTKLAIKRRAGNVTSARAEAGVTCLGGGRKDAPGPDEGTRPHRRKRADERAHAARLTESSFHVIGRTAFGIPDQLNFRSSSVGKKERGDRVYTQPASVPGASSPPVSVIGAASR